MPLVVISEERKECELQRALDSARSEGIDRRHLLLLMAVCTGWVALGFVLLGLGFHLTDPDRAQAAFLSGVLAGNGGPAWTLILSHWIQSQR